MNIWWHKTDLAADIMRWYSLKKLSFKHFKIMFYDQLFWWLKTIEPCWAEDKCTWKSFWSMSLWQFLDLWNTHFPEQSWGLSKKWMFSLFCKHDLHGPEAKGGSKFISEYSWCRDCCWLMFSPAEYCSRWDFGWLIFPPAEYCSRWDFGWFGDLSKTENCFWEASVCESCENTNVWWLLL